MKVADLKTAILGSSDVQNFINGYKASFEGFHEYLNTELMQAMTGVNISKEEAVLSKEIFQRLSGIPLVDAYEAYQILDNDWNHIAVDLEIIQTEGFPATKQVDPNMIVKKKDGKDQEVQDGWVGHVVPFDLVQQTMLSDSLAAIQSIEDRLAEITSGYEEALDELPEEEKDKDFVNDDKTAFVWPEVKKAIKAKEVDVQVLAILKKVSSDNEEEKKLKERFRFCAEKQKALHIETKKTIETLSDEQVYSLLDQKWISPLIDGLGKLPESIISDFIAQIEKLAAKYETTFADVEDQIQDTEKELSGMIDLLTGSEFDMAGLAELKKMLGGM